MSSETTLEQRLEDTRIAGKLFSYLKIEMDRIFGPIIRCPAGYLLYFNAGYPIRPFAGYPANVFLIQKFYLVFLSKFQEKFFLQKILG
jgi:hypothetical protein